MEPWHSAPCFKALRIRRCIPNCIPCPTQHFKKIGYHYCAFNIFQCSSGVVFSFLTFFAVSWFGQVPFNEFWGLVCINLQTKTESPRLTDGSAVSKGTGRPLPWLHRTVSFVASGLKARSVFKACSYWSLSREHLVPKWTLKKQKN